MSSIRAGGGSIWARPEVRAAAGLGLASAIQRFVLWRFYAPIEYSDTAAYLRLAEVLSRWTLDGYDGTRVPGYPAFLALFGLDLSQVWAAQLALGWGLGLLLFLLTWWTTRNAILSAVVGGLYSVIPGQFLFESNLLTESLTAALTLAALVLTLALGRATRPVARIGILVTLGIAAAGAGLVRALFFIFPAWLLLFVVRTGSKRWPTRAAEALAFLVPVVILLGGWIGFIQSHYGMLAPDTMGGYHLIQHTGAFFEYLPDEHAALRDTYLKYRDQRIAERGDQTNTIWDAIPEMSEVSGLGFYDLSRELQRLSVQLILDHPFRYARSAVDGWIGFWKAPVYWDPSQVRSAGLRSGLEILATVGRALSLAANAAFLLLSAAAGLSRRIRRALGVDSVVLLTGGWVWVASVLQTLPDHGDNPRFLVPLQMVVIFVVLRALVHARHSGMDPAR